MAIVPPAQVHTFPSSTALDQAVVDQIIYLSKESIGRRHIFTLGISGSESLSGILQTLASDFYQHQINWHKTHIFLFSDLPKSLKHLQFNLVDHIDLPPQNLHHSIDIKEQDQNHHSPRQQMVQVFGNYPPAFDLIIQEEEGTELISKNIIINANNLITLDSNSHSFSHQ